MLRQHARAAIRAVLKTVDELDWNNTNDPEIGIVPTTEVPDQTNHESQFSDFAAMSKDVVLLDGPVFPLKESVKPFGFNFERNFNGIPGAVRARPAPCPASPLGASAARDLADRRARAATQDYCVYWVAPVSAETINAVAKLFNEWGWKVTIYDGAEGACSPPSTTSLAASLLTMLIAPRRRRRVTFYLDIVLQVQGMRASRARAARSARALWLLCDRLEARTTPSEHTHTASG